MSLFLRDQFIKNVNVDEKVLQKIGTQFENLFTELNQKISTSDPNNKAFLIFIIRMDGKGYKFFSSEDLLRYFQQAKEIERIIFTLETAYSRRYGRENGTNIELRLDKKDPNNCTLTVCGDNENWVDSSFVVIQDIFTKFKNKNGLIRNIWTPLGIQIVGVIFGFLLSLLIAVKIYHKLAFENSFIIAFLFVLLIFSNTWSHIYNSIMRFLDQFFPNLKFSHSHKNNIDLFTSIVISLIATAIFSGLVFGLSYLGHMLYSLITTGT